MNNEKPLVFEGLAIENQKVAIELPCEVELTIKREDKNHPYVSGNKLRKLKYNIFEAQRQGKTALLTFGGAYSNHIAATAAAGKAMGMRTIGVIRGDELASQINVNPTLKFSQSLGMEFLFVTREAYRHKTELSFLEDLRQRYGSEVYIVPEGGTNELAVRGTEEILTQADEAYDVICTAVGTGGTIAGLINASADHQTVLGFPALNGKFLEEVIKGYTTKTNWQLIHDYNFGGYAKVNDELIEFLNNFNSLTKIPLDPIYVGKMIFAIFALAEQCYFKQGTKVLAIHTGGLQGIQGFNKQRLKKNKSILSYDEEI